MMKAVHDPGSGKPVRRPTISLVLAAGHGLVCIDDYVADDLEHQSFVHIH